MRLGYYTYPGSQVDLSYAELYVAPTYAVTPKLTLGLSVYYGPNYYRTGASGELRCRQRQIRFRPRPHLVRRTRPPGFGTTANTPPIKLPDYIYGHVGATHLQRAVIRSALPRHDPVATKLLSDHRHDRGWIERLPADHRRYSVLEPWFVRAEIRLRRGTVMDAALARQVPAPLPCSPYACGTSPRASHSPSSVSLRYLGHIAERAIAQLLSVRHTMSENSAIAFGGCLHASDQ